MFWQFKFELLEFWQFRLVEWGFQRELYMTNLNCQSFSNSNLSCQSFSNSILSCQSFGNSISSRVCWNLRNSDWSNNSFLMSYIRRTRIAKVSATQFWIAKVSAIRAYAELPEFRQFNFELPKFQQFDFELPKFQQFKFELPKFWQFDVVYRVTSNWISDTSIRQLATVAKPGDPWLPT